MELGHPLGTVRYLAYGILNNIIQVDLEFVILIWAFPEMGIAHNGWFIS